MTKHSQPAPSESPTPASEEGLVEELSARIWCDPVINSPFDNAMRVEVHEFVVRELQPIIRAYVAERVKEAVEVLRRLSTLAALRRDNAVFQGDALDFAALEQIASDALAIFDQPVAPKERK